MQMVKEEVAEVDIRAVRGDHPTWGICLKMRGEKGHGCGCGYNHRDPAL